MSIQGRFTGCLAMVFVFFISGLTLGTDGIFSTTAGNGVYGVSGDGGRATEASFMTVTGVGIMADGSQILADANGHVVRKIDSAGIITTICGDGTPGYSGDGGPAKDARLSSPCDVAIDSLGNIYIVESGNHTVRKIGTDGIISTFAGTGRRGHDYDSGPANDTSMDLPLGVAVDANDNVYIADYNNGLIRKANQSNWMERFVGDMEKHGNYVGDDGPALDAGLSGPSDVAIGPDGTIYILERDGFHIRKVDTHGIIATYAGTGTSGYSGDGGPALNAQFNFDAGQGAKLACDNLGNLYIADSGNHAIRLIDLARRITTVAGSGISGYSGDNGWAFNGKLQFPYGIACKTNGDIVIADTVNSRMREVNMNFGASAGINSTVSIGQEISMKFDEIVSPGNVTVDTHKASDTPAPGDLQLGGLYIDINTSAVFTGKIIITLKYAASDLNPRVLHYSAIDNAWRDVTVAIRPPVYEIDAQVDSLSPFVITDVPDGYQFVYFRRGDANDDGALDISDAVYTLFYLFASTVQPQCFDALDANDDGKVDVADVIRVITYLFLNGDPFHSPGPQGIGLDPTQDELDCVSYHSP